MQLAMEKSQKAREEMEGRIEELEGVIAVEKSELSAKYQKLNMKTDEYLKEGYIDVKTFLENEYINNRKNLAKDEIERQSLQQRIEPDAENVENVGYALKTDYLLSFLNLVDNLKYVPSDNQLKGKELPELVKQISSFIYIIETE